MKYATPGAFRAALETRLKNEQTDGVGVSRLRKRVVFERLLARLQAVAPDSWYLKGGFALELRLGGQARSTCSQTAEINCSNGNTATRTLAFESQIDPFLDRS